MKYSIYLFALTLLFFTGCAGLLSDGREDLSIPAKKSAEAARLMKEYKYAESIAAFQKIIEEYPNSSWAANSIYSLATIFVSVENPRRDYAHALTYFDDFLYQYPQHERAADAKNWRQAVKMIIDEKKENAHLLKNIEKLKQLDMRQERKRLGK